MTENWSELPGEEGGNGEGQETEITKEHQETLSGDAYVYYIDCDDGFIATFIGHNLANCPFYIYAVYYTLINLL